MPSGTRAIPVEAVVAGSLNHVAECSHVLPEDIVGGEIDKDGLGQLVTDGRGSSEGIGVVLGKSWQTPKAVTEDRKYASHLAASCETARPPVGTVSAAHQQAGDQDPNSTPRPHQEGPQVLLRAV